MSAQGHDEDTGGGGTTEALPASGWLACERCGDWSVWDNCEQTGSYTKGKAKKAKYTCRLCKLTDKFEQRQAGVDAEVAKLRDRITAMEKDKTAQAKSFAEIVSKGVQEEKKTNDLKLTQELGKLKTDLVEIVEAKVAGGADLTAIQLRQAADEVTDIEKRRLNLIVSGFSELGDDLGDFILFANNCHALPQKIETGDIVSIERIGQSPGQGRPRLLRIQFSNPTKRRLVLTMNIYLLEKFRTPLFRTYIRPDLTRAQQEHDKKLRQELMSEGKGKEKFMIHRGKVVPRELRQTTASSPAPTAAAVAPAASAAALPLSATPPLPPQPSSAPAVQRSAASSGSTTASLPVPTAAVPLARPPASPPAPAITTSLAPATTLSLTFVATASPAQPSTPLPPPPPPTFPASPTNVPLATESSLSPTIAAPPAPAMSASLALAVTAPSALAIAASPGSSTETTALTRADGATDSITSAVVQTRPAVDPAQVLLLDPSSISSTLPLNTAELTQAAAAASGPIMIDGTASPTLTKPSASFNAEAPAPEATISTQPIASPAQPKISGQDATRVRSGTPASGAVGAANTSGKNKQAEVKKTTREATKNSARIAELKDRKQPSTASKEEKKRLSTSPRI